MSTPAPPLDEDAARRVLLVQAYETGPADGPLWTAEDRVWATRLARETSAAGASAPDFVRGRAHHALQRLGARDPGLQRTLARRAGRPAWVLAALCAGLLAGLLADAVGNGQRVNLLAPPVWGVVLWNLFVYALLPWPLPPRLRAALARRIAGQASGAPALRLFHTRWLQLAAPLCLARAALLLHAAAAALAVGLIAGLYLRGLVLDYRAGWQSTFLDASQVHAALAWLLAPAAAVTGIAVPDVAAVQALRVAPEMLPPASAAPWIHLYAATLGLFVVLPRTLLMLWAALRAAWASRHVALPWSEPYFQRLLQEQQGRAARVQVLPHGAAPSPHALACLQAVLAGALGSGLTLQTAAATAYGSEETAAALLPPPGTTLRALLVDLGATPEDDTHGLLLRTLRRAAPQTPLIVLADETAFRSRFATLPARLAERRAAWQQWAQAQGVGLASIDLAQPDAAAAERALQAALGVHA